MYDLDDDGLLSGIELDLVLRSIGQDPSDEERKVWGQRCNVLM